MCVSVGCWTEASSAPTPAATHALALAADVSHPLYKRCAPIPTSRWSIPPRNPQTPVVQHGGQSNIETRIQHGDRESNMAAMSPTWRPWVAAHGYVVC